MKSFPWGRDILSGQRIKQNRNQTANEIKVEINPARILFGTKVQRCTGACVVNKSVTPRVLALWVDTRAVTMHVAYIESAVVHGLKDSLVEVSQSLSML